MQLWQALRWPALTWDAADTSWSIAHARVARDHLHARASWLHPLDHARLELEAWTREAMATARLEGESISVNPVRSSVARRLGIEGIVHSPRDARAEATLHLLEATLAAAEGADALEGIDEYALVNWYPGAEGRTRGEPAAWPQLQLLVEWFNVHSRRPDIDAVARAAIAHLWVEAVRPFERGNGRIARALAELALLQDMRLPRRLVSLSARLLEVAGDYRAQLRATLAKDDLDVTKWVRWYAQQVAAACDAAAHALACDAEEAGEGTRLGARAGVLKSSQRQALVELLAASARGEARELSTERYVRLTGVSRATAWRELSKLVEWGLLVRSGDGRGTRYRIHPAR